MHTSGNPYKIPNKFPAQIFNQKDPGKQKVCLLNQH
jgi:hypothetical protein